MLTSKKIRQSFSVLMVCVCIFFWENEIGADIV